MKIKTFCIGNYNKKMKKKKFLFAALLGTVIEYYDYTLYGFLTYNIAETFFPLSNSLNSLIMAFGVFAIGYISKPLGSILFGYIGDAFGRKYSLQITILGIAIPTAIIGVLPGYQTLGIISAIIVFICRFSQGIFVGGEHDGASIFLLEHYGSKQSGLISSLVRASSVIGILLGAISSYIWPMLGYGFWRCAFLLSLPFACLTFYLRKNFTETPVFIRNKKNIKKALTVKLAIKQLKFIVYSVILFGCSSGACQMMIIFFKSFLQNIMPDLSYLHSSMHLFCIIIFGFSMIMTAIFSDKIGRVRIVKFSIVFSFLISIFLLLSLKIENIYLILSCMILISFSLAPTPALLHSFLYNLFPVNNRYKCLSLSHTIGSMLFSGSAPFIAMYIYKETNIIFMPGFYLIFLICIGYISFNFLINAKKDSY